MRYNPPCVCGRSSSGRARPCQGRGSEFEPRRPLQKKKDTRVGAFLFLERRFCAAKSVACGRVIERERGNPQRFPPHTPPSLRWVGVRFFVSGGLFSFSSERKEEKKRRQKLRFWISLRGFTRRLFCLLFPRENCATETSPKYCIVSASRSAAAFALKCRRTGFYRGRDQRQRRRRRDDPFDRTTKSNPRDRVGKATNNYQSIARRKS